MDAPDHPVCRRHHGRLVPAEVAVAGSTTASPSWRSATSTAWPTSAASATSSTDVAVHYPLYVILSILGLPEEDFPRMLKLTQELFGAVRPGAAARRDARRARCRRCRTSSSTSSPLTEDRRANPTDDLASVIANADAERRAASTSSTRVGYYVIIATAGHDTTSSSIAGGLHALLAAPRPARALAAATRRSVTHRGRRDDPLGDAGEAVHAHRRPTTTCCAACRSRRASRCCSRTRRPTATRRCSSNADRFDVGRNPNKHVAFGFGAHYCLGAQLARMEGRALYNELMPAAAVDRARRRAVVHADAVRRRAEAPADPLRARLNEDDRGGPMKYTKLGTTGLDVTRSASAA